MTKRTYDSTVARIAGNIAGALVDPTFGFAVIEENAPKIARVTVAIARAIVAETQRTEPAPQETDRG